MKMKLVGTGLFCRRQCEKDLAISKAHLREYQHGPSQTPEGQIHSRSHTRKRGESNILN
jgi:hypothetical protein